MARYYFMAIKICRRVQLTHRERKASMQSACSVGLLLHDFQMGWAFRELMCTLSLYGYRLWNSNAKPEVCKSSGHVSKCDFGQLAYNYPVVPGRIKNKIHIHQRGVKCCQMPHDSQQKFPLNSLELEFHSKFLSCKQVLVQFSAHSFSLKAAVSPSWTVSQSMVNGFSLFISLLLSDCFSIFLICCSLCKIKLPELLIKTSGKK